MSIQIKIHNPNNPNCRKIISICDSELLGKNFEEGKLQLEVKPNFYKGEEKTKEEIHKILETEEASFNIVGKESIEICKKAGLINDAIQVQGIPFAMVI